MTDLVVRVFPVGNGNHRATLYHAGEDYNAEAPSAAEALIYLGEYLLSLRKPSDNETLMRIVLEGQTDEIRNHRRQQSPTQSGFSVSKDSGF